ncbi:MAG TPA: TetR/AcrR family transcriptional regulator [Solirubrobacteraceae bacterium]|nr:TetR/AcrR family transcriptional regulator [Solirubrobacteraceae bacterium]
MTPELGLRERKKQRTRQLIADTAWQLFAQRGFDHVPVAEIAGAAEVSEATVFNYFATKEDLVFHRMEAFEQELLGAIRDRPADESIVRAFGRFVLTPRGFLASTDPEADESMRTVARVMTGSPALQARQRDILDRYTDTLARLIAEERGAAADDVEPWVIANALIGVHRALISFTHRQALAGVENRRIARNVRAQGKRALAALEHGLG